MVARGVGAGLVDRRNRGVIEPGGDLRLAPEARETLARVGQGTGEQLECNPPLQSGVLRQVDLPLGSLAQETQQAVGPYPSIFGQHRVARDRRRRVGCRPQQFEQEVHQLPAHGPANTPDPRDQGLGQVPCLPAPTVGQELPQCPQFGGSPG